MTRRLNTYSHLLRLFIPFVCMVILVLASLYAYFLSRSVLNVVLREEIESQMVAQNSAIGELEAAYLELKDRIGLGSAESFSLGQLPSKTYVERRSLLERALTLHE